MLRFFLPLVAISTLAIAYSQGFTEGQRLEIFETVWKTFNEKFYDPKFNGVNWAEVKERYLPKIRSATSRDELFAILRSMVGELRTPQVTLMSAEEIMAGQGILPFAFERINGRCFVTCVYRLRSGSIDLRIGDEILEADGAPPTGLAMFTLKHYVSPISNPYFGRPSSTSTLTIRRGGKTMRILLPYVSRFRAVKGMTYERLSPDLGYLRLLTLGAAYVDVNELIRFFSEMRGSKGLIIDLRYAGVGDISVALTLASLVSRPNTTYCYYIGRKGRNEKQPAVYSDFPPKVTALERLIEDKGYVCVKTTDTGREPYGGPLAVLVNAKTEGDSELLAAFLQHSRRAILIGEATAGTSGVKSESAALPYNAGYFQVPTREVRAASGRRLDAAGLKPDIPVKLSIESLSRGEDPILEQARRLLAGKRN